MGDTPNSGAWGQAKDWIERPLEFWGELQRAQGDVCTVEFGSLGTVVLFCRAAEIREVFGLPADAYECRSYNDHYRVIMGENSLLVLDGEAHQRERRRVAPAFQPQQAVRWVEELKRLVRMRAEGWKAGETLQVRAVVHAIVFESMLHTLFGAQQPGVRRLLSTVFAEYLQRDYGSWSPWARFAHAHPPLRALIAAEIARARQGELQEDSLFARLVQPDEHGQLLSDAQIQDHVFTMLIAGVDTSALATTWALHFVHKSPSVAAEVRAEAGDPLGDQTLLHRVCLETLRMVPVVTTPSGRKLLREAEIGERSYEAGMTLVPCTYLAHRDPEVFEEPEEFRPGRFVGPAYRPYEYFPFGGGGRVCIGARMALVTMKTILGEMLRWGAFEEVSVGEVAPVRHGTLLAPSENFRLRVL